MNAQKMTLFEIQNAGLKALRRDLGLVGMIRFLQQYENGSGDYTAERRTWLPEGDVKSLAEEIRRWRDMNKDNE